MFAPKYAYKSLMRRKSKNLTIILAIALGVALFVGVQFGNRGLLDAVARIQYDSIHNTDLVISSEGGGYIPANTSLHIKDAESYGLVDGVEGRISFTTGAFANNQIEDNVLVTGIDPEEVGTADRQPFDTFRDDKGVIITGAELNTILGTVTDGKPHVIISKEMMDELDLSGTGEEEIIISVEVGNGTYEELIVIADTVFDDTKGRGLEGNFAADPRSHLYIHLDSLRELMVPSLQDYVSYIAISLDKTVVDRSIESIEYATGNFPGKKKIEKLEDEINVIIDQKGLQGLRVYSARIDIAENIIDQVGVTSVLNLFVMILNSIALLLIVNVQLMSVEDRKNQTAVLRALGSDRRAITTVFLIEASVVGIIGGLIGVLLGIPLSKQIVAIIGEIFHVPTTGVPIDLAIIVPAMIIGLVLSIITAVAPAISASGEVIANALRGIEAPKKPRKGYLTVIFGLVFTIFGLMSAANVGKFWSKEGWETFDDIQSIGLSLGLTLAGVGMLLTLIINRRVALNISAVSLWGLAVFILLIAISWVDPGDPGNTLTFVMFYMIFGATLLISQNYEFLMRILNKFLSLFPKLRPISQVTSSGMIGRKTRGILVFTIFSIILTLNVFVISTAETIRTSLVDEYGWRSDGVDVVVDVQAPVPGITGNLTTLDLSETDTDTIDNVFAFRKTVVPFYTKDISVPNIEHDPADIGFVPVIEVNETMINPDNWGDNSFQISLMSALAGDKEGAIVDEFNGVEADEEVNDEKSAQAFRKFFDGHKRLHDRTYDLEDGRQTIETEDQVVVFGANMMAWFLLEPGSSLYMQSKTGVIPMYMGAQTFDMLGSNDIFGIGILVTPEIAATIPQFDDILNPNLYLVRSSNGFDDKDENELLALAIEKQLNERATFGLIIGANTRIVKEEIVDFNFTQAGFWDFLGIFSSLGLIIGTIGMSIIAIRSVSERIREIGMMRSIGFSRKSVVQGVIIELVVLSILGLIIGIINGVLFTIAIVENLFQTTATYPVGVITLYVLGVILISIIAGVIPGYRASRVTPSQALRYTG
ncbi:MAG: ABC transporter permease [Candidatus Kariarchaeaceae archaeon]|jgi:ABC-type antimicrobial peptide transport system permease subunit